MPVAELGASGDPADGQVAGQPTAHLRVPVVETRLVWHTPEDVLVDDLEELLVVYQNVLGRSPDQAGFDYWYAEVRGGLARHLAVRWIAGSAEFSNRHPYLPQ